MLSPGQSGSFGKKSQPGFGTAVGRGKGEFVHPRDGADQGNTPPFAGHHGTCGGRGQADRCSIVDQRKLEHFFRVFRLAVYALNIRQTCPQDNKVQFMCSIVLGEGRQGCIAVLQVNLPGKNTCAIGAATRCDFGQALGISAS